MSNPRNRRGDRRRPRSRSMSPQIFSTKHDLRNDLRNNLRHRSRSRSPRMFEDRFPKQQYSPTDNFRERPEMEDEDRFYLEQQHREEHFLEEHAQRSSEIDRRNQPNRRNFRSRSREFYEEPQQLNFEPIVIKHNTRFSPPDPNMNMRNQQFVGLETVVYPNKLIEAGPIIYKNPGNNINPFVNTMIVEQPKLTPSNVSWQPPPNEVMIIADPELEPEIIPEPKPLKEREPIPVFDPENEAFNSKQFIEKLDELGKINKWNEEEFKFNFVTHLQGGAKSWQIHTNRMLNPWNNIKRTFMNTFPPTMDFHQKLKDMINRQMTRHESIKTYVMHKAILLNQVDISGRRAVSCIIAGLQQHSDEIKKSAFNKNLGTPEEVLAYLAEVENDAKAKEKAKKKRQEAAVAAAAHPATTSPMSEAGIIQSQQIANQRLQVNICYNCLREGHASRECPSMQPARRQVIPKHYIEVSINGISFQGYNDLSSSCVTIREVDAKKANIQFHRQITCIRGFGNTSVTALGVAHANIRVDRVILSFDISIVPNAAQDIAVVIGKNFRNHPDVRYIEAEMSISFTHIQAGVKQNNNSFSANERLMASFNSTSGSSPYQKNNRNDNGNNKQMVKERRRY